MPSGSSSWVAYATWQDGGRRRQTKHSFRTRKEARTAPTELLAAHQSGTFVARGPLLLRDFAGRGWPASKFGSHADDVARFAGPRSNAHVLPRRLGNLALQELRASDLRCVVRAAAEVGRVVAYVAFTTCTPP
jgi:hypothetical protein